VVEASGNCSFLGPGDQTDAAGDTYELGDWGCVMPLPDGTCLPTVAIDQDSPAIDVGSCTGADIGADAREVPRPFDFEAAADADDGCDAGAFEAIDADGDGYSEAADCAPFDRGVHLADACGVCDGDGSTCALFTDGFESGDTAAWSGSVP
jgi:hypothetical protein